MKKSKETEEQILYRNLQDKLQAEIEKLKFENSAFEETNNL